MITIGYISDIKNDDLSNSNNLVLDGDFMDIIAV